MKKYWLTLLVTILLFSSNGVYADVFIGDWKLFVTSAGKEISDNQPSIGLGISKAGTFYNVQVELPIIRQTPKTGNFKERGGWGGFLQASQEQQVQYSLAMIRDKYTGKYVLSDDEKTLENINGSVSFKYRKNGEMICSSDIGCFNHGKANMASSPQTENVGDTGTPPASHEGTAGTTPQQGHTGSVMAVNVSPDGKYFTSGSGDKTVKIWNTTTGECVATLLGHLGRVSKTTTLLNGEIVIERSDEGEVRSVSWSPDGKNVASGSVDETVRIWDVSSGEGVGTFAGHSGWVLSVNYSPDGRYVASGSSDKTVKIWNIASGQCIKTLEGHTSAVLSVNYSPDGRYVASGSSDKTIKIWDIASGECVKTLEGHAADVNSVNYSRDGRYIASGSDDKTIKIWDIASGECVKTLEGHVATVNSVSYARNGRYIASGSDDKTIKIWDIASGECVKTLKGTNSVRSISYAPDGKAVACGSGDKAKMVRISFKSTQSEKSEVVQIGSVSALGDSQRKGDVVINMRSNADSSGSDMYIVFAARSGNLAQGNPGHAFVGWGGSNTSKQQCTYSAWGFYPRKSDAKAILDYVPAAIKNDAFSISPKTVSNRLIVRVDSANFGWIEELIETWATKKYNLFGQNCISFMMDVAKSAGLKVPPKRGITLPDKYVKALIAANQPE